MLVGMNQLPSWPHTCFRMNPDDLADSISKRLFTVILYIDVH
jgi:hypothetical protein